MPALEAAKITVEEYQQMPETGPRYQLIDGTLHLAPAPNRCHQDISRNLEFLWLLWLKKNPIGVVYNAPLDVVFTRFDVCQPDLIIRLE